jgi:hypothetical protein
MDRDRPIRLTVRRAITAVATTVVLVLAVSCSSNRGFDPQDCESIIRHCRTVCDYWCDRWGCYPVCWDQCWEDCIPRAPSPPEVSPPVAVGAPTPPPADGGGVSGGGSGSGALCAPCASNEDCSSSALCILRGGPATDASASDGGAPAGTGFCGQACNVTSDCPQGFACAQIGSTKQCLPNTATCN